VRYYYSARRLGHHRQNLSRLGFFCFPNLAREAFTMKPDFTNWKKNWSLMHLFFSPDEIENLRHKLSRFQPRHIFYCSFENRFARSGGLAAVAVNTLPFLRETGAFDSVSLMSPFYPNIMDRTKLSETGIAFDVPFDGRLVRTGILHLEVPYTKPQPGTLSEYYLWGDGFFGARNRLNDPYLYIENDPTKNERALQENALFFSKAVPVALAALGVTKDVALHLQEWQTSLLCLTTKQAMLDDLLDSCGTVQTMHNPYDTFISKRALKKIITGSDLPTRVDRLPGDGLTAFEIGLQLVDAPVVTVSENFALELTTDILQTDHFAPHLQSTFLEHCVIGINNGPFVGFSEKFPKRKEHTLPEIAAIKLEGRAALLKILDAYKPSGRFGELTYRGDSILGLPEDVPIVVMSGRLDTVQKGYDILLQALERFEADEIKAVLTPMALRDSDLDFFREVAGKCHGNVTVFPMKMQQGYLELQTGATFGVMPSIYEPFGAAIEYMVNGTVNIARSTGGLVNQVVHGQNGFLFRERADFYDLARIKDFALARDNVQMRRANRWAVDMAEALYLTLKDAAVLYQQHRNDYYAMILRGFAKAASFSWEENAANYALVYKKIATA
jgi:glycogen synthase